MDIYLFNDTITIYIQLILIIILSNTLDLLIYILSDMIDLLIIVVILSDTLNLYYPIHLIYSGHIT